MKLVLFRDLPAADVADLAQRHPALVVVQTTDPAVLRENIGSAEVIFGNVPPPLLRQARRLRWLQIVSSGFDEYQTLRGTKARLTTAHGLHAIALAEHVVSGMLLFARDHLGYQRQQRERIWDRRVQAPFLLAGQRVGILGYGEVGRALAARLRPFGMRLQAVKRSAAVTPPELDRLGTMTDLDRLLSSSQHVVVTLPLTPKTRGVLNAERIGRLKQGAYFYNVARGGLVDEDALAERLRARTLGGGALLDVFEQEPLPPDSPFWCLDHVVVTPHMAGHDGGLSAAAYRFFLENLERYLRGEPLRNVANFRRRY